MYTTLRLSQTKRRRHQKSDRLAVETTGRHRIIVLSWSSFVESIAVHPSSRNWVPRCYPRRRNDKGSRTWSRFGHTNRTHNIARGPSILGVAHCTEEFEPGVQPDICVWGLILNYSSQSLVRHRAVINEGPHGVCICRRKGCDPRSVAGDLTEDEGLSASCRRMRA